MKVVGYSPLCDTGCIVGVLSWCDILVCSGGSRGRECRGRVDCSHLEIARLSEKEGTTLRGV